LTLPVSGEIETLARQDQHCERLMTVPGIGQDMEHEAPNELARRQRHGQ
jgi:hypothetical protein